MRPDTQLLILSPGSFLLCKTFFSSTIWHKIFHCKAWSSISQSLPVCTYWVYSKTSLKSLHRCGHFVSLWGGCYFTEHCRYTSVKTDTVTLERLLLCRGVTLKRFYCISFFCRLRSDEGFFDPSIQHVYVCVSFFALLLFPDSAASLCISAKLTCEVAREKRRKGGKKGNTI